MKKILPTLLIFLVSLFLLFTPAWADEQGDKLRDLENKIKEYEQKIEEAQSKQRTLSTTISVLDNQIYLTEAKIFQTTEQIKILETEIEELSQKIVVLESSLTDTSSILKVRIEETYKRMFVPSLFFVLNSKDFSDMFSNFKYLQAAQKHDKEVMFAMEETKQNFDQRKKLKQEKQQELKGLEEVLASQKIQLDQQKGVKQDLLVATQNDEKKFQSLLAQARAEYEAIQAIIAGRGDETEAGEVKAGDVIATVISGSSCNSSGTHLHFTVADKKGNPHNPFSYLKTVDHENCSGGGACSAGDPFDPRGSWEWPISPKITFSQGYGSTWAIQNTWVGQIYSFHNGIDIRGSSSAVKAVQDGTLYRGSYSGSGGCALRYVRVDHKDGDLQTFYLHVNY